MEIRFNAHYGDEVKKCILSKPEGINGAWFLTIDNYHRAQMFIQNGRWVIYGNIESEITIDDIQILGEMIDDYKSHSPSR